MKTAALWFAAVSVVLAAISGCLPEKVVWSPDGRQALVQADCLYLMDANGGLSRLTEANQYAPAAWFPDSRRFVFAGTQRVQAWREVERGLLPQEANAVIEQAERFRAEILASREKDVDLGRLESAKGWVSDVLVMMKMYLAERHAQELKPRLGKQWDEFEGAAVGMTTLAIGRAAEGGAREANVIACWPGEVLSVGIAPDGNRLAVTTKSYHKTGDYGIGPARLYSLELGDGTGPRKRLVSEASTWYFDWSPDSRSLLYCREVGTAASTDLTVGSLVKHRLLPGPGEDPNSPGEIEEIAAVAFSPLFRQRWLRDGRIVFVSVPLRLPATAGSMPKEYRLYVIHPGTAAVVCDALPERVYGDLPDMAYGLQLSPDGRWASVPGEKSQLAVVDLVKGEVRKLVGDEWGQDCRMLPVWRSTGELCFVVPPGSPNGSPKRAELVLYHPKGAYRCISKDWPDAVMEAILSGR